MVKTIETNVIDIQIVDQEVINVLESEENSQNGDSDDYKDDRSDISGIQPEEYNSGNMMPKSTQ